MVALHEQMAILAESLRQQEFGAGGGDTTVQIGTVTLPVNPTSNVTVSVLADSTTVLPEGVTWDSGGEPTITERMLLVFVWSGTDWVGTYGPSIPVAPESPDTTGPTPGTLAASAITSSGFTLTVSGASDDEALHAQPYRFSTDNGVSFSAWQAGATFDATGLDPETEYTCVHQVRDAALNVATGSSIPVTTEAASGSPYEIAVLADSPYAYWRFEEVSGTTLADTSGNGYAGTLVGGDLTVAGARGSGIGLDGTDDHSLHTTLGSLFGTLTTTGVTFEFWVKTATTAMASVMGTVNTGTSLIFNIALNTSVNESLQAGTMLIHFRTGNGTHKRFSVQSSGLTDNAWHHVVISRAPGMETAPVVYIDGTSRTVTVDTNPTGGTDANLDWPLSIGGRNLRGVIDTRLNGQVDEVAIYDYALSGARALAHFEAIA